MDSGCVYLVSFLVFCAVLPTLPGADTAKGGNAEVPLTSVAPDKTEPENTTAAAHLTSTVPLNGTTTKTIFESIKDNKDMLMRAFYVLIGVTAIVMIYFGVRAWRLRRKRNKTKKYGLIAGRGADYEMAPLDADDDDDDEDTTVFEMNRRKK